MSLLLGHLRWNIQTVSFICSLPKSHLKKDKLNTQETLANKLKLHLHSPIILFLNSKVKYSQIACGVVPHIYQR